MKKEIRLLCEDFLNEDRKLKGYAALFNSESEDLGGFTEVIVPGAFRDLDKKDIRAFVDHNSGKVLGRTKNGSLKLFTDERGLYFELDIPDTTLGRDIRELVSKGIVDQCSFGFVVLEDEFEHRADGTILRKLNAVDLIEISIVSIPAYSDTSVAVRKLEDLKAKEERAKEDFEQRELDSLNLYKAKLNILNLSDDKDLTK